MTKPAIMLAGMVAMAPAPPVIEAQQQNPLAGIWSTRITDSHGRVQRIAYVEFGLNGALYRKLFPRSVGSGGAIFQEWGIYRFVQAKFPDRRERVPSGHQCLCARG